MTLIQPKKQKNIFTYLFVGIGCALLVQVIWLIVLYNQTVNARHGTSDLKGEYQNIQTESAELKDKIFSLLDTENLENFAQGRALVQEKNPQYLEVAHDQKWVFASQL